MTKIPDRKALGKGLAALLPGKLQPTPEGPPPVIPPISELNALQAVSIDQVDPNPLQPRTAFDSEKLTELANSIRENGIIQPLIVQRAAGRFHLIAGERRWRAARIAGLTTVPVLVKDIAQDRILQVALIENIQREDLSPIEVAHALERLATEYHLSHEDIGKRTGKERTTVTNLIRLLKLPNEIQTLVSEHRLNMGHARALLGLPRHDQQVQLAERAAAQGLSVRQVERLVQSMTQPRDTPAPLETNTGKTPDPNVAAAARELEGTHGTRVRIVSQSPDRGRIEIDYFSVDELDRIYNLIVGRGD